MQNFSKNIISTILYYDILDYPLTAFEVWKYLLRAGSREQITDNSEKRPEGEVSLFEVMKTLGSDEIKKYIEEKNGFYFLKGRGGLVESRLERDKISQKKMTIIRRVAFWIRLVPFIRMVAVTGTVAMKNSDFKSDLDLLIVLGKKRIFIGRTLVTALVQILGRRRHGRKITNRICLNYFLTEDNLETDLQDLFSSSEYSFILPIFGEEIFRRFQKENKWIEKYRENFRLEEEVNLKIIRDSNFSRRIRTIGEVIFDSRWLEETLGKWQLERIEKDPRTKKPGSAVLASSKALLFLPSPQGPGVFEEFQNRLEGILAK